MLPQESNNALLILAQYKLLFRRCAPCLIQSVEHGDPITQVVSAILVRDDILIFTRDRSPSPKAFPILLSKISNRLRNCSRAIHLEPISDVFHRETAVTAFGVRLAEHVQYSPFVRGSCSTANFDPAQFNTVIEKNEFTAGEILDLPSRDCVCSVLLPRLGA